MVASFLIFKLWLAPMAVNSGNSVGAKLTLQVGSNLWVKVRVKDAGVDLNKLQFNGGTPVLRAWAETDF